jgi:peptidoglycan hydrolase-like protein with peptidoglycan-binding domain
LVTVSAAPAPPLPRYGTRSLGELVPSLLSSLGVAVFANPLAIEPAARVCLLLVDGLGWELLRANPSSAPFLNSIAREPLTAGFPATTAASLSSLAIGVPTGEHGLVGYTMALPGYDRAFNTLTWSLYGVGPRVDLVGELMPESFQPIPTLAERAAAAGLRIHHLGPAFHEWSGLTRAIGRGERFHAADSLEALCEGVLRLLHAPRTFVFGYHPRLDAAGHVHGVASQAWKDELIAVDHAFRLLAEQVPKDTVLVVTGDHGMVDLRPEEKLDLADNTDLAAGVRILGGEARARYVGTVPGATDDVLAAWQSRLGDQMWVWRREEAIATGIFGPNVTGRARERMGDILAAAYGRVGIVERNVDPAQARLNGHHGSLTAAEQIVPLLLYRG